MSDLVIQSYNQAFHAGDMLLKCNSLLCCKTEDVVQCVDLLFGNLFTMIFSFDVGVLISRVAYQVLIRFLLSQDWNDLVAFLTAILHRCVSYHIF